jgi:hypothetical protein
MVTGTSCDPRLTQPTMTGESHRSSVRRANGLVQTGFSETSILENHRNAELAENLTFQALRARRAKRFANALVSGIPY